MLVAEAVGRALAAEGVDVCFGVLGSGNLVVTNALREAGVPFHAARHEGGAMAMADGYARASGRLAACSVHQGPGLTNAVTALTEAAKSRTPLLLLAADTPAAALRSNFRIAQDALVEAVSAVAERVHGPATAIADVARAARRAREERRAVVLMLPLDVQAEPMPDAAPGSETAPGRAVAEAAAAAQGSTAWLAPRPAATAVEQIAALLEGAERPALIGGRGAVLAGAGPALRALGERCGAILAMSAVANGLFRGDPFDVGIAGGFSSPLAARLLAESDVIVAFGAALNQWTTRHGALIGPDTRIAQVDLDAAAIGAHRPVAAGAVGDAAATAEALLDAVAPAAGRRSDALAAEIAAGGWHQVPFTPRAGALDPRALTIALDALLPEERTVVVDSGHFMGWPSMYLRVPDAAGFVFPQAFQCVGLGLGSAIGAALARPDRLTVAALGDGGALMALPELETLARLRLPLLVVVYDDEAYGAEVHHFRPLGHAVDLAQFPPADLAALATAAGCRGLTVRTVADLDAIRGWLATPDGPLLLDAKVDPHLCADWLEEAFRGH
jgi:thiamine pyrophosphate-dependent acetolactate synthase large subunit-like protein